MHVHVTMYACMHVRLVSVGTPERQGAPKRSIGEGPRPNAPLDGFQLHTGPRRSPSACFETSAHGKKVCFSGLWHLLDDLARLLERNDLRPFFYF